MGDIEASRLVASRPDEVFAFLSDLENHWEFAGSFIEVLSLERASPQDPVHGGLVRMRGPLGLGRTAITKVEAVRPPRQMTGTGRVGRQTLGRVQWTLTEEGTATRVRLSASIESASALDRGLLMLGGREWLRRRFVGVLHRLGERFSEVAEEVKGTYLREASNVVPIAERHLKGPPDGGAAAVRGR